MSFALITSALLDSFQVSSLISMLCPVYNGWSAVCLVSSRTDITPKSMLRFLHLLEVLVGNLQGISVSSLHESHHCTVNRIAMWWRTVGYASSIDLFCLSLRLSNHSSSYDCASSTILSSARAASFVIVFKTNFCTRYLPGLLFKVRVKDVDSETNHVTHPTW